MHSLNDLTWRHAQPQAAAPLADALLDLPRTTRASFHALPLSCGRSVRDSGFAPKFHALFGHGLGIEATVGAPHFDAFFFPQGVLAAAEKLAAEAFGAQDTLFVTAGTTLSNQIAIEMLTRPGSRVLLDKGSHQSMHFALATRQARIDYAEPQVLCTKSERSALNLDDLVTRAAAAEKEGDPYTLLVLNGQSYDGIIYDVLAILKAVLDASPSLAGILVDEAWGAWTNFHPDLRGSTALHAARTLQHDRLLNVVVTHSAHKSMSALRQASYIHCVGEDDLGPMLRTARYRLHTTSPSYPILGSLDLARAQMATDGRHLTERCVRLSRLVADTIRTDPALSGFAVNDTPLHLTVAAYARIDPTKLSLDVSRLPASPLHVRDLLYREHRLYVNRYTTTSLLLNFHIGVDDDDAKALLEALRFVQAMVLAQAGQTRISTSFLIPYPPGVPLVVPGQEVTVGTLRHLDMLRSAGVQVFSVEER